MLVVTECLIATVMSVSYERASPVLFIIYFVNNSIDVKQQNQTTKKRYTVTVSDISATWGQ